MRVRSVIQKCTALFLLLVFLQKTGVGLLFHDLVHAKAIAAEHASNKSGDNSISYACTCIDDFLMPFTQAEEPVVSPVIVKHIIPVEHYASTIPFYSPVYSSLRGPPACIQL